jgi:hypothetical protein
MNPHIPDTRKPSHHIRAAAALCIAAAAAPSCHCDAAAGASFGGAIALTIGSLEVSEACVNMNFRKFVKTNPSTLNADQIHVWVQGFVQRQIVTAEAINEGYGQRPEVAAALQQMEEHMLTDSDGPLYRMLLRENLKPCSPDEVYARQETTYQMELMGVPISAPVHAMVSRLIGSSAPGADARVADQMRRSGQVEYLQGPFVWPFDPGEAASEAICNAPVGRWQTIDDRDYTVLFRVASKGTTPRPPREKVEGVLERIANHCALQDLRHRRESDLLTLGSLGFDWDAAEAIVVNLRAAKPEAASELTPKMLGLLADRPVAHLEGQEGRQVVTIADFAQYYNSLFIRKLPERAIDIYDFVKDILMFRRDLREARRLGLDTRRDFVEHKENYRNELILNLYEKEQVRPKLGVGSGAVADYYNSHREEYERPTRISGRVYTFDGLTEATAFAKAAMASPMEALRSALNFEPLVATPETSYPGVRPLSHIIFSPAKPKVVGPLTKGSQWVVWAYERTLEATEIPFANVEQQILYRLQQPLIGPFEKGLARSLSEKLPVDNRISEDRLRLESGRQTAST